MGRRGRVGQGLGLRLGLGLVLGLVSWAAMGSGVIMLLGKNVIDRDQITLGDIWSGLPESVAMENVAPAPAIGSHRIFSAIELDAIAAEHRVKWRSASPNDRAIIERTRLMITVPVTLRPLARGEIIRPTDLGYMRVKSEQVSGNVMTATEDLVGKAMRRSIGAAAMLGINDVEPAKLVLRNAPVTVRLRTQTLYLTLHAKALQDGALGDRIRVENPTSKQVIIGIVRGAGLVDVELP
ncbi:MAG: flagellar basal body P-ring formation chaperone FlgA [Candidatus Symbiobacter sp.]|nr:flagellar basal body P-ring formation chaperone FlgA [Candidatus Symbiobacter sp.]